MEQPAHSPLGASSAERWMNCPGSTALIKVLTLPETDEPDYRANGIAISSRKTLELSKQSDGWKITREAIGG